ARSRSWSAASPWRARSPTSGYPTRPAAARGFWSRRTCCSPNSTCSQRSAGAAFLVAKNLPLPNSHVLGDRAAAEKSIYRFNFQNDWTGAALPVTEYHAKPGGTFVQGEERDFALCELDGDPGATWGFVPLRPGAVAVDTRVSIIQHPGGQAKQISMQNNLVEFVDDKIVQYVTSTLP